MAELATIPDPSRGPAATAAVPGKRTLGRPPRQRRQIAASLRDRIHSAAWKPGQRLTPRRELVKELGVSTTALQAAIDQLHAEGFVDKVPGRGTFVAERPPHLFQHALVLPETDGHFYQLLEREARARHEADHHHRFKVYRLPNDRGVTHAEAYAQLASDLDHRVVAGLIISIHPGPAQRAAMHLAERSGLPVTLHGSREDSSGLPIVRADMRAFTDAAIDHLRSRGRSRLALLCADAWYDRHGRHYEAAMLAAGLPLDPIRLQHFNGYHPRAVRNLVQLLFAAPDDRRPDGLIVMDHDLATAVAATLEDLDLCPGDAFDGVTHVNFPLERGSRPAEPCNFARLGFDASAFFDAFLDQLRTQGDDPANPTDQITLIPPRFG